MTDGEIRCFRSRAVWLASPCNLRLWGTYKLRPAYTVPAGVGEHQRLRGPCEPSVWAAPTHSHYGRHTARGNWLSDAVVCFRVEGGLKALG